MNSLSVIRRFFRDGLHWVAIVGLVLGYALYHLTAAAGVS